MTGRIKWQCPQCSRTFLIRAGKEPPNVCPDCLENSDSKGKTPDQQEVPPTLLPSVAPLPQNTKDNPDSESLETFLIDAAHFVAILIAFFAALLVPTLLLVAFNKADTKASWFWLYCSAASLGAFVNMALSLAIFRIEQNSRHRQQ